MSKSFTNLIGLVVAFAIVFIFFCIEVPGHAFQTFDNIQTILRQSTLIALLAIGSAYVIISAGIDLSVGSVAAFSGVVVAALLKGGFSPILALLGGIVGGVACGFINGTLITRLKVVPFIVTLGSLLIFRAIAKGVAHEQSIYPPASWLDTLVQSLRPGQKWMIVPVGVWVTIFFACFMAWMLRYTRFGRHVVAIGSNEHAARLCGVPIDRVKVLVYVVSGFFAGVAGLMLYSRLTTGDPTAAYGYELDAIAAVVIGGASLSGGEGSIAGAMIGALIMQTIRSGSTQMGLPNWVQEIVTGGIIVLAVAIDRWRVRRALAKG